MNDTTFWILFAAVMAASLGLLIGVILGDEVRRRKNAEENLNDLRQQLKHSRSATPIQERQLKEIRSVLNDTHKQITAVTKALLKPAQ